MCPKWHPILTVYKALLLTRALVKAVHYIENSMPLGHNSRAVIWQVCPSRKGDSGTIYEETRPNTHSKTAESKDGDLSISPYRMRTVTNTHCTSPIVRPSKPREGHTQTLPAVKHTLTHPDTHFSVPSLFPVNMMQSDQDNPLFLSERIWLERDGPSRY